MALGTPSRILRTHCALSYRFSVPAATHNEAIVRLDEVSVIQQPQEREAGGDEFQKDKETLKRDKDRESEIGEGERVCVG